MEKKHLVLVGAGHAHLETMLAIPRFLAAGFRVSVINPDEYQYYSGMGPGMLAGFYPPRVVRFNVAAMSRERGADFIRGRAARILPDRRTILTESGDEISYDVASFNVGSVIAGGHIDTSFERVVPVKPVYNLYAARCRIEAEIERPGSADYPLAVIGGGAAGVEVAANLKQLVAGTSGASVVLLTRGRLLSSFPSRVRRKAMKKLGSRGVRVIEDASVQGNSGEELFLATGETIPFRYAFAATGTRPPELFRDSAVPVGPAGGLLVDENLKNPKYPELFGGGDCVDFASRTLPKVGVYAVRQNPILRDNLLAALSGAPLREFSPQGRYLLILNMGDRTGIWQRNGFVIGGRLAFRFKDKIDRAFMEKYQVSGEASEGGECGD